MRTITRLLLAGFVIAATALGCAPQKDIYSSTLGETNKDFRYENGPGYARYTDPDISIEVSYLNPEGVELYFSKFKGGKYMNPVPPRSFAVFSLTIDNRGTKPIDFNPSLMMLVTGKNEPLTPKDYAGFYTDLSMAGAGDVDERMNSFRATCFDTAENIPPGQSVHKLVVYQRSADMKGGGTFMMNGLHVGHETKVVSIQYEDDLSLSAE